MSSHKIMLGQVGFGYWGSKLFKCFNAHPNFKVSTVVVNDLAKRREGLGNVRVTGSLRELLADRSIDAVVIATPTNTHYEIARQVLESGKHIFTEKLFTRHAHEASALVSLARARDLNILVDHTLTFSAALGQMRDLINAGEIGEVSAVYMAIRQLGHFVNESVYDLLSCHLLSVLNMMFPLSDLDFQRNDLVVRDGYVETGSLLFRHKDTRLKGELLVSVDHPDKERIFAVYGDKGTVIYNMLGKPPLVLTKYDVRKDVSMDPANVRRIEYGSFDESNNIALAVEYFYRLLAGEVPSNDMEAIQINTILDMVRLTAR